MFWEDRAAEQEFYKRIFQTKPFKTICGDQFDSTPVRYFAKPMALEAIKDILHPNFNGKLRDACLEAIGEKCCEMFLEHSGIDTETDIDKYIHDLNIASKGYRRFKRRGNLIYEEKIADDGCWCPIINNLKLEHRCLEWCDCSKSARTALFSSMSRRPVKVEILDNILCNGSDTCRWLIQIDWPL
jgi:hypothetical protein